MESECIIVLEGLEGLLDWHDFFKNTTGESPFCIFALFCHVFLAVLLYGEPHCHKATKTVLQSGQVKPMRSMLGNEGLHSQMHSCAIGEQVSLSLFK